MVVVVVLLLLQLLLVVVQITKYCFVVIIDVIQYSLILLQCFNNFAREQLTETSATTHQLGLERKRRTLIYAP